MSNTKVTPTYQGYIANTKDALLVIQAALNEQLPTVPRRPHDKERASLITSGNVFVFIEERSGVKRWTDGVSWSPSRILGRFLIYRELDRSGTSKDKKKKKDSKKKQLEIRQKTNLKPNDSFSLQLSTPSSQQQPQSLQNSPTYPKSISGEAEDQSNRALVGSLVTSYAFKDHGLVKKTLSLTVNRPYSYDQSTGKQQTPLIDTIHLISYYSTSDVLNKSLTKPSLDPSLKDIQLSAELCTAVKESTLGGKIPIEEEALYFLDNQSAQNGGSMALSMTNMHPQVSYFQPYQQSASQQDQQAPSQQLYGQSQQQQQHHHHQYQVPYLPPLNQPVDYTTYSSNSGGAPIITPNVAATANTAGLSNGFQGQQPSQSIPNSAANQYQSHYYNPMINANTKYPIVPTTGTLYLQYAIPNAFQYYTMPHQQQQQQGADSNQDDGSHESVPVQVNTMNSYDNESEGMNAARFLNSMNDDTKPKFGFYGNSATGNAGVIPSNSLLNNAAGSNAPGSIVGSTSANIANVNSGASTQAPSPLHPPQQQILTSTGGFQSPKYQQQQQPQGISQQQQQLSSSPKYSYNNGASKIPNPNNNSNASVGGFNASQYYQTQTSPYAAQVQMQPQKSQPQHQLGNQFNMYGAQMSTASNSKQWYYNQQQPQQFGQSQAGIVQGQAQGQPYSDGTSGANTGSSTNGNSSQVDNGNAFMNHSYNNSMYSSN